MLASKTRRVMVISTKISHGLKEKMTLSHSVLMKRLNCRVKILKAKPLHSTIGKLIWWEMTGLSKWRHVRPLRHMPQNWHTVITAIIMAMFTRKGSWLLTTKQENTNDRYCPCNNSLTQSGRRTMQRRACLRRVGGQDPVMLLHICKAGCGSSLLHAA